MLTVNVMYIIAGPRIVALVLLALPMMRWRKPLFYHLLLSEDAVENKLQSLITTNTARSLCR